MSRFQVSRNRKRVIWRRDNFTCQYCGLKLTMETATTDHIIPLSKGGSNEKTNLVTACFACNNKKGDGEHPLHSFGLPTPSVPFSVEHKKRKLKKIMNKLNKMHQKVKKYPKKATWRHRSMKERNFYLFGID